VVFAHDTEVALLAAVRLANSALAPDTLTTTEQLADFFGAFEYTGRFDRDEAELAAVRQLRADLHQLLVADRDEAVRRVNEMLAAAHALPQLVRHDDWDWHVHAVSPDAPLGQRISVETAMAMIDVIRADDLARLSTCADDGCEGVVLDLSRNRSRRFCSTACTNRNAVAAYRARRAGS
jgi:predicted RNA-binding Zn ribbon-like protein